MIFKTIYNSYSRAIRKVRMKKYIKMFQSINFTIISSDCIGGILYSDLKKRFLSPTINLSFDWKTNSFYSFVSDMDFYFNSDVIEHQFTYCPVGKIIGDKTHGDVYINFAHYGDFKSAIDSWNKRKLRVQNNKVVIVVLYEITERDVSFLDTIKYPLFVVTSTKTKKEYLRDYCHVSKYLSKKEKNDGKLFSFRGLFGRRNFDDLKIFDWLKNALDNNYENRLFGDHM